MHAEVRLFAGAREAVGRESVEIEIDERSTAIDVIDRLADEWPQLADLLPSCRLAVDDRYVGPREVIPTGGSIALIPPVSGG